MGVFSRFSEALSSHIRHRLEAVRNLSSEEVRDFFENSKGNTKNRGENRQQKKEQRYEPPKYEKPKSQLEEDLALFQLKPPTNLQKVTRRRNEMLKKYHPDRFHQDPEKEKTAKEMIQIYLDAYERIQGSLK